MTNKEKQEFLVPVTQWVGQWRRQEMFVSPSSESQSSNPISTDPRLEAETPIQADNVSPKIFKPKFAISGWTVFWVALSVIMSSASVAGYWLLTSPPTTADCHYNNLIVTAGERLYCAQQKAESGKLKDLQAAMALAKSFPQDAPLYNEAQRLIGEWSLDLVRLAQQKVDKGDLAGAKAIVKQIPTNSISYSEVARKSKRWQRQWQYGAAIEQEFQTAIKKQNWQKARGKIESLYESSSDYWRVQTRNRLLARLAAEKQGWQLLKAARKVAKSKNINNISAAIVATNRIKPQTNAKSLSQADRQQWSQAILQTVATKYQQQDFTGAIALAKKVPQDVPVARLANDWITLSQASQKAQSQKNPDISNALAVLRQISPQSPLYKQAQGKIATWKKQLNG